MKSRLLNNSIIWLGALLCAMLPAISAFAVGPADDSVGPAGNGISASSVRGESAAAVDGKLKASLVTCAPGPEIYELFGHEAIRIKGTDSKGLPFDSVWNYGVFDFNSPNFVFRFVKGETDYMLYGCPYSWFIGMYVERGSGVTEQELNFTQEETEHLRHLLQVNALPANRTYRYNYVRDNCSTRVADIIEAAVAPRKVIWPDTVKYASFRTAMRDLHRNYPWYQFGIDLALGSGIDRRISSREELFAPLMMEEKAAKAVFSNGEPLVKATDMIYPGKNYLTTGERGNILPPTPFWLTPHAVFIVVMLISLGVAWMAWRRGFGATMPNAYPASSIPSQHGLRIIGREVLIKAWYTLFFGILGLSGCLIWFLVFISVHDSTSPNLLALWLNPLQLVIALCIWWRRTRPAAIAMGAVNVLMIAALCIWWPWQPQVANSAIFPLWAATAALSAAICGHTRSR